MDTQLNGLLLPSEYREQRSHIFSSPASLDWLIRKQRFGLVEAGALLVITGRWFIDPIKFDSYMLSLGSKKAREAVS